MSDNEMDNKKRFARTGSISDSSDEDEAPQRRRVARDSSPDEGLQDSSPEGVEDTSASSTESSAPKVSGDDKDGTDSEDDQPDREAKRESPLKEDIADVVDNNVAHHRQLNGHHDDDADDDDIDEDDKHDKEDDSSATEGEDDDHDPKAGNKEDVDEVKHQQQQKENEPVSADEESDDEKLLDHENNDQVEDKQVDGDIVSQQQHQPTPTVVLETPSPPQHDSPSPVPQDDEDIDDDIDDEPSVARKSSNGSSSSYGEDEDEERRASSMSPEPAAVISAPPAHAANNSVTSPTMTPNNKMATTPTNSSQKDITKIYTEALVNENGDSPSSFSEKIVRSKPAGGDITQIYTASLQKEQQSPRLERARGGKPVKDITQLYTAAFSKESSPAETMPSPNRPRRNDNITKMYTGAFESNKNSFRGKPNDEITNPRKHNMATSLDREAIRSAYTDVMSDNNGVEWAAFKFDEQNKLVVSGTGEEFNEFKSQFGPDDRGFGYIKIQTGDEMSKRSRFLLITWVGSNVSVMKKAKMSTDKLLVKEVIQNLSVELQMENPHELSLDHLKAEVDKAGGAS